MGFFFLKLFKNIMWSQAGWNFITISFCVFFIDDMLTKLSNCKLGCIIKRFNFNAIMYADALLLLSISVHELQLMVNICLAELPALGLKINIKKSVCVRVGPRYKSPTAPIVVSNNSIVWSNDLKYLGITIGLQSGMNFKINMQPSCQKYFGALNGIYSKWG